MNGIESVVQIVIVFVATVLPVAAAVRLAAGHDADLTMPTANLPWPRGVQEEEPKRWSFGPAQG